MLVRQTIDELTVVDLTTGEQLWHRWTSASREGTVTDGRRLLVAESVEGTGPVVAAYDVRDGRRLWEVPVPVALQFLAVVDHRLFGFSDGTLIALGTGRE
jgi:outer membrane protein assembly factor BamB